MTPFNYLSAGGMRLTPIQEDLLSEIEAVPFITPGISTIGELRSRTDCQVVVSDKASFLDNVKREIKAVDDLMKELYGKRNTGSLTPEEKEVLHQELLGDLRKELEDAGKRIGGGVIPERGDGENVKLHSGDNEKGLVLLGLYCSWDFSYNAPTIYLFGENIYDYARKKGKNPDNVFAYVYVHEAMHAYYDMEKNGSGLRLRQLEEPFAEFGMLTFLYSATATHPGMTQIAQDAVDNVEEKQVFGPFEYGFGMALSEIVSQGDTEKTIDRYREVSDRIRNYDSTVRKYKAAVSILSKPAVGNDVRYNSESRNCYELVKQILDKDWMSLTARQANAFPLLEPHARAEGIQPKRRGGSPYSKVNLSSQYCTVCEPGYRHTILHPLFSGAKSSDVLSNILMIIKNQGIDRYLSIGMRGRRTIAVFHGTRKDIPLCVVDPIHMVHPGDQRYFQGIIFSINGMDYVPARILGMGVGMYISDAVQVLADWFGVMFSVVSDATGRKTVYGPKKMALGIFAQNSFPSGPSVPRSLPKNGVSRDHTRYDLTDLQGNVCKEVSKAGLVFEGVRSFVEANPRLTVAQVQAVFPRSLGGWGPHSSQEVVKPLSGIAARQDIRYSKGVLSASDGDVRVSNQWNLSTVRNIIDKLESLGMTVQ